MIVLAGIIAGLILAWVAIRIGLYVTWAAMFNLVISIYIALSLGPVVAEYSPLQGSFAAAAILVSLAAATFVILQGACHLFITGQYDISFPKVFESVTSGIIGFLAGMLIVSFLSVAVEVVQQKLPDENNYKQSFETGDSAYLDFCYNTVHLLIGTKENIRPETLVAETIKNTAKVKKVKETAKTVDDTITPVDPNEQRIETVITEKSADPPEFDFDNI